MTHCIANSLRQVSDIITTSISYVSDCTVTSLRQVSDAIGTSLTQGVWIPQPPQTDESLHRHLSQTGESIAKLLRVMSEKPPHLNR